MMQIVDLGLTDFYEVYKLQLSLVTEVANGRRENTLLIVEHSPVITLGRSGSYSNILKTKEFLLSKGIKIFEIDRGGDVTYHGPGQVIAYPIFKLESESRDIHNFLNYLEEVGIYFLSKYGIIAERIKGNRGVWVREGKICSIGIGVKRWVTYHGIAVNINMDLTPFSFITPCGIKDIQITSLEEALGREVDIYEAREKLKSSFKELSLLVEAKN